MQEKPGDRQEEKLQSHLKIHLKKDQRDLPDHKKIEALQKRDRSKWWQLGINFLAILFFGYSFYYDITQLGNTFFIIIFIVFGINVGLLFYQKKQIAELITYLEKKTGGKSREQDTVGKG